MDEQDEVADETLRLAQSGDSSEFFGPVPEERIDEAERELGRPLTGSYRTFLRRFGAGHMLQYACDGLPDPDERVVRVIRATRAGPEPGRQDHDEVSNTTRI
jgi:hypothetical protein